MAEEQAEVPEDNAIGEATEKDATENTDVPVEAQSDEKTGVEADVAVEQGTEKQEEKENPQTEEGQAGNEVGEREEATTEQTQEAEEPKPDEDSEKEQSGENVETAAEGMDVEQTTEEEKVDGIQAVSEPELEQNLGQQTTGDTDPLPESSTFGDGERPETPVVAVTDPLSREASPVQEPQLIQPGTPERLASPVIEYEEYDDEGEEEQIMSREELIECYQAALAEREQLQTTNTQFQHKLAEYFRKKKTDEQRQEMDKNVTDQEQRYLKYLSNLEELRKQEEDERENLQVQEADLNNKKDEKLALVDYETNQFAEFKKQTALNAINSRTGKPILPKDVEQYLLNEMKKEEEVKQVRLENIKLKNRLKKREQQLKAKEELAEGLHLIDFEQLKIENQTYNEKIEERNEELLKLRKKITSTVQVLTHVKEKLQFVQAENQVQKTKLRDVEEFVAKKRDVLSRTKKARDKLRIDNQRQMQKCGLLGNKPLLRDFEERKDEGDELRARLEYLKQQHAELTLDSNGLRRKIEEARSVRN